MADDLVYVETDHSAIGPSSFERAETCPASLADGPRIAGGSSYSVEGDVAHVLLAECVVNDSETYEYIGANVVTEGGEVLGGIDDDMANAVFGSLDHIRAVIKPETLKSEHRLTLFGTAMFGQCDIIGDGFDGFRHVMDLKYGMKAVYADSVQIGLYGLMDALERKVNLNDMDDEDIVFVGHVLQPRLKPGVHTKEWTAREIKTLLVRAQRVDRRRREAKKADPVYVFGPHCTYCKRAPFCPAVMATAKDVALAVVAPTPEDVAEGRITKEDIERALEVLPAVENWAKAVRAVMSSYLLAGGDLVGGKVVVGRSSRDWVNESDAESFLESHGIEPYQKKILSPAKAEKALPREVLKKSAEVLKALIEVTPGRPTAKLEVEPGAPIKLGQALANTVAANNAQKLLDKDPLK